MCVNVYLRIWRKNTFITLAKNAITLHVYN